MPLDPRLENYLSSLDRALVPIPVSDRADIVTEIKSHVLAALDREPSPAMDSVLASLGEPEIVANRYLLERGLRPGKPPVSPIVKWVVIGFLGTLSLLVIFFALLLSAFSPLVHVDEKAGRVILLGGLIDVNEKTGTFRFGDSVIQGGGKDRVSGSGAANAGEKLLVKFHSGKLHLGPGKGNLVSWDCSGRKGSATDAPALRKQGEEKLLDLTGFEGVRCELLLPQGIKASVEGASGKLDVEEPRYDLDARLSSGKVLLSPDPAARYAFDLRVQNGRVDSRESDPNPEFRLQVQVENGKISIEEKE